MIDIFRNIYIEQRNNKRMVIKKKIAFLFLVYDKINHEELWKLFFDQDVSNRHSIYVHYKNVFHTKYFHDCILDNCVDTKWGDISLVKAQNLLLKEAMKDKDNLSFIFCSGSCIPLKTFDAVYNYINPCFSYFNIFPSEQCFPRCNNAKKYVNVQHIQKASQWCILNREHVMSLLNDDIYIKWFEDTIGDEHCYITYLCYKKYNHQLILTHDAIENATTFANWNDGKYIYGGRTYTLKNYGNISVNELLYLIKSRCLFGRKFDENCNLTLLKKVLSFSYLRSNINHNVA
jgi:hypothetical protein